MNVKQILLSKFQNIKWSSSVIRFRSQIESNSKVSTVKDGRYCILLPHADDELIGCDQLMKSVPDSIILNMDMEGGDSSSLHIRRREELSSYVDSIGRKLFTISEEKAQHLRDIIKDFNPDVVFVPSFFDWHPEHFQVMQYLAEALGLLGDEMEKIQIAMYQVSVPLHHEYINMALSMDRQQYENKWAEFQKFYKSQLHLPTYRFGANERINGKLVNSYAAEAYIKLASADWLAKYQLASQMDMTPRLRPYINNLIELRKQLNVLYAEVFI